MGDAITEAIARQSDGINVDDWRCLTCRNYKGNLACNKNVFIAFTGANMNLCAFYERGQRCAHYGKVSKGNHTFYV